MKEVFEMLKDSFRGILEPMEETKQIEGLKMIQSLAEDIMNTMDKDGSKSLDWSEFKHYFHIGFNKKENDIADYLKLNY